MQILKQEESEVPATKLCHDHGIVTTIFYNWRNKCGGMNASPISQMKAMAAENSHIDRIYGK